AGEPVVFKRGYGYRRMLGDEGEPVSSLRVTTRTNFRVASLTKPFTAAAALELADEGQLSLDDAVTKWLPGMPDYADDVTIRHLLTHKSGVASYWRLMNNRAPPFFNDLAMLRKVATAPKLDFPAGKVCVYSNTGYVLLGLVVQQASGQPFHTYLHDEVLRPLGMERSRVLVEGLNQIDERAYGHKPGPAPAANQRTRRAREQQLKQFLALRDRLIAQQAETTAIDARIALVEQQLAAAEAPRFAPGLDRREIDPGAWHEEDQGPFSELRGDGTLYTSIDDLQQLVSALREGTTMLSAQSLASWLDPQTTPEKGSVDRRFGRRYTCGWMIDERLGERRYSHRGATRGFRQTFQWMPESGRAVAILMNSVPPGGEGPDSWDDARIERLGEQVLQAVLSPTDGDSGLERLAEPTLLRD
ncbi:MAG: serine hydrolase domain-containing protein, partial [Planctomycetota bacterium]